jgi:hypothetical protein
MGRPKAALVLRPEQREQLEGMASSRSLPAGLVSYLQVRLAEETRVSKSTVHRIWQAFGLEPHRQKHLKVSSDPFFVEKSGHSAASRN